MGHKESNQTQHIIMEYFIHLMLLAITDTDLDNVKVIHLDTQNMLLNNRKGVLAIIDPKAYFDLKKKISCLMLPSQT